MLKYFLLILLLGIVGFAIWFLKLSGAQQLNYADLWYPGKADVGGHFAADDIGYGSIDKNVDSTRQGYDEYWPAEMGRAGDAANCDGKKYPTIIFFHGGGWHDGDRKSYAFVGRAFAARGFITVMADYRKAPEHQFPAFIADTARAIGAVYRSRGKYPCADSEQIYVMGHSAGAHIAMLAAMDPQWLAAEGLETSIVKGVIGLAGPYDFLPFEPGERAEAALGNWPQPKETQPISYARADAPPILLLHGADDKLVGKYNSENMKSAIEAAGGHAEYKLYDNVDHYEMIMAVARPFRGKAPVISDVINFIETQNIKKAGANSEQ